MKLKNKKTGEIGEINYYDNCIQVVDTNSPLCGNSVLGDYRSLAELCEEWEDYKEPKELYFVDARQDDCIGILNTEENPKWCARLIELGLSFETAEETEKAAEKLKAWKRLEQYGVRFCSWFYDIEKQEIKIKAEFKEFEEVIVGQNRKDLDILFGGENANK